MSLVTSLLKWTGENLASGALQYFEGVGLGALLEKMGVSSTDDEIAAIGDKLDQVQSALSQIQSELDALWKDIDAQLKKIEQEQLYISWQSRDELMQQYITQALAVYHQYIEYINSPGTTSKEEIERLVGQIEDPSTGPANSIAQIQSALCGTSSGDKGALQLWTEMTLPLIQAGTMHYAQAVQAYCDYYAQAANAQLRDTNLLVEAYNYDGNTGLAKDKWNDYRTSLLQQEECFMAWLIPLVTAGIEGGYKMSNWDQNSGNFLSAFQFPQALHDAFPGVNGEPVFYQPSPAYAQAEELLAALYVTQAEAKANKFGADRRIVVHMVCNPWLPTEHASVPDVSNAPITLTISGTTTTTPTAQTRQPFDAPFSIAGQPLIAYHLVRFVFSDLKDGTYQLTDLNGRDYPPIHTSEAGNTPFQGERYLDYQVTINQLFPADFINFTAYEYGVLYIYPE